jgi:paired amphipathic helix protein Sin3a
MDAAPTTPALPVLPTDMSTADVQMKDETTVEDKVTEDVQLTETSESGAGEVPGHETTPNPDGPCPSEEVPMAIIAPDNGKEVQKSNSDPLPDVNRPQETVIITRDISIPPISRPQSPSMPPPSRPASRLPPMGSFQVPSQPLLERPLNVTDALGYLDAVKVQFHDQPDVYNHFLDIMKDFKSGLIDTPGVIKRVSHLFNGHPNLIQGFNTFLPVGYRIECSSDPQQSYFITVTTPTGTMRQSTRDDSWPSAPPAPPATVLVEPDANMYGGLDSSSIEPAVQYVQKIKQRCDEATYRRFLEILGKYHNTTDAVDEREVSAEIARLFKDDPDLRADFRIFMPEKSQALFDEAEESYLTAPTGRRTRSNTPLDGKPVRRRTDPQPPIEPSVPQKRKRKANERDTVSTAPKAPSKLKQPPLPPSLLPPDDTHFFDRVKRALGNRDTYNEFLKLVNLFTQELIDTARLVREARNFLGDAELMRQFREILGWDDRRERERWVLEESQQQQTWARAQGQGGPMIVPIRPGRVNAGLQQGSYRRMPASEANVACAGRDEMCRAVLNDEWVSHPTWSSEDAGFIAHRKNIYEEALHRSEEERHEYDFHVEAATRTITILEPLAAKIAQLPLEERSAFKLKPNLGGSGKAVHARVIKKIYGREAGLDVLQAMQDAPALAIPVVLMRLKEKEEEWKRAQREWNKVWREVDARNASRALDHAGIACKAADKKSSLSKSARGSN